MVVFVGGTGFLRARLSACWSVSTILTRVRCSSTASAWALCGSGARPSPGACGETSCREVLNEEALGGQSESCRQEALGSLRGRAPLEAATRSTS